MAGKEGGKEGKDICIYNVDVNIIFEVDIHFFLSFTTVTIQLHYNIINLDNVITQRHQ